MLIFYSAPQDDAQENAKYELLVKRDQEMTAFVDKFDEVSYARHRFQSKSNNQNFHISVIDYL